MNFKCKQIASFFALSMALALLLGALGVPLPIISAAAASAKDVRLIPGGMPFGVKFSTEGVLVVGFCDVDAEGGSINPAYAAGLRTRDVITALDGKQIADAAQFGSLIAEAGATPLTLTYTRAGKAQSPHKGLPR